MIDWGVDFWYVLMGVLKMVIGCKGKLLFLLFRCVLMGLDYGLEMVVLLLFIGCEWVIVWLVVW